MNDYLNVLMPCSIFALNRDFNLLSVAFAPSPQQPHSDKNSLSLEVINYLLQVSLVPGSKNRF